MTTVDPFTDLQRGHYAAILADPPWHFQTWKGAFSENSVSGKREARKPDYKTMRTEDIASLPVCDLAADDCVLFLWACWPHLEHAFRVIDGWGFIYKTCAFSWLKGDPYRLWADEKTPLMGLGYWTRANTEPCLLATRGKPKRQCADVRQGIIAPKREHSRKPDEIHGRIERLVAGPYLELFARTERPGWTVWGNETNKFAAPEYAVDRVAAGGA